ncbi:transglycosylase SLT domain-containing protein [Gilvimarinus xylanilyticus]|uniref:Transglycosylase SLT domain-containing protein n=1 Tax=Gilvimarinus xylanilyticus TaxID=2944139 RepID=A0A9X2HW84_9GAMM|nr:transglycosylase SLT domain-containing protein [Gilvimarinus xylanilyticus]MCP8898819.1 transglycosylase SLT domain-containing protein [Gilvimarinus xylanilyticus]
MRLFNRERFKHSFYGKCHLLSSTVLLAGSLCVSAVSWSQTQAAPDAIADKSVQRKAYAEAHEALSQSRYSDYRELRDSLATYPLLPYIEYRYITRRISRVDHSEIDQFLARYPDSYLADKLERLWIEKLAEKRDWESLTRYYRPENSTTTLACLNLRARINMGDKTALDEVAALWDVDHSQPKACDPVFAAWMQADRLTDDIAWSRFVKTMDARQRSLARYISKQMSPETKALADLYYRVDSNPRLLRDMQRFSLQSSRMQDLILHGLQRLSLRDAALAIDLWHKYDAQQLFDDQERIDTQRYIAVRLLRQDHTDQAEALLASSPALSSETVTQWLIRDALRKQDWERVQKWIGMLPADEQASERWRYWRARALTQQNREAAQVRDLYAEVAKTRSFYGFLAADILGQDYELVDKPIQVSQDSYRAVSQNPGIVRARELYIIGENLDARREWYHTTRALSKAQVIAAGKLAENWGWHRNGIQAMIQASYWDDLQTRFPLAYQEHVNSTAKETAIEPHLLFAIARQESAFTPDARSSAGALGLMQLLPSTAKQTARRNGMSISTWDLLTPETNIALGGRYLGQLLNQFDGNRILAAAAYNAGPTRVKQWLNDDKASQLPFDIWIETIPYRETRGYVQNVLAYSVIYGYRLGDKKPFITQGEAKKPL